ncbi:hypothetical protein AB0C59_14915 [Streptomyces sp. NPDC048664]|uniref:hypothetical protein n=1 Tax=Streptomyces sp. NPDC048664 TaxID=3154505 RepID=UPI003422F20D
MRRPALTALALAAALPLALTLTACSSGSSTAAPKQSASKDPNAHLATGAQLKKALAPASFFASGFAEVKDGTRDTGSAYIAPSAGPASAKPDCELLDGTSWINTTGVGGVSFAQSDYLDKNTSEEVAQEVDTYRGSTAAKVMQDLHRVVAACASFTDSQTHTKVKVTGEAASGPGDEAYTITLTDSAWENGSTLIASRVGTNVVTVLSSDGHDNGAATAKKLTARIAGSLRKAA